MTLGGMLKHLAYVEDLWFSRFLHGRDPEPPWDTVHWDLARLRGWVDPDGPSWPIAARARRLLPRHRWFKVPAPNTPADLVMLADLEADPHPALARLRAAAPVSWVPALGAWLVTGYDPAVEVLRDAGTFTVDDPRFSTAKVVGPSMLSLDGARHARHRAPFTRPFRADEIHARLESFTRG